MPALAPITAAQAETRFVGRYQTQVAERQARLGILWTGLTRPPRNDTIDLDDTVAGDPDGTAGVSGEINGTYGRAGVGRPLVGGLDHRKAAGIGKQLASESSWNVPCPASAPSERCG